MQTKEMASETQLQEAAQTGRRADVKRLLDAQVPFESVDERQRTPLFLAAEAGHSDVVQLLIAHGAALEARDQHGKTALMRAAMLGLDDVVELLIASGARVNAADKNQVSSLMWAALNGQTNAARLLVDSGARVNEASKAQLTALMLAAKNGHESVVQLLMDHGAQVHAADAAQRTSLMRAADNGHYAVVILLVDRGAHVNLSDRGHRTPLMLASLSGHDQIARLLIESGAQVDARDKDRKTPLLLAVANGHDAVVRLLIECGAQVDATDKAEMAPLTVAAKQGQYDAARSLIARGAHVNVRDKNQQTPLIWAAVNGHEAVARLLITHGAHVDAADKKQLTPLMLAAKNGHEDVVRLLLDQGASVNMMDKLQQTPLMRAAMKGNASLVRLLIDHEADVNAVDINQWTPLMWATQNGFDQVVRLLVSAGASVNATASDQQTALMLAAQNGREIIAREVMKHDALVDATNDHQQTALMLAASEGHDDVVRALLSQGASLDVVDLNGETALMYAISSNHEHIVRELLQSDAVMSRAMALLKLGLQKRRRDAEAKRKESEETKAEVKLADLGHLCSKMNEAQAIGERIYSRLVGVENQLSTLNQLASQEAMPRFKQLVTKAHGFMLKHANNHAITRLVGSHVIISTARDLNREVDAFLLQFNLPSDSRQWMKQWEDDAVALKLHLQESLRKTDALAKELHNPQVQKEALTLLMFECDNHASQYTDDEMALIHKLFQDVSSMSQLQIHSVPQWFVPPHEVEFNAASSFARGSYGSVHRGTWNGTAVVVKQAFLDDEQSREMFLNETEIWFRLQHPHIVTLFRACHVGNPFFVCDWASNGTLSSYLYREEVHLETWTRLHEAALGLQYLHTKQKVVHGDLKCNNILVSADGKAKLTDFGLSFVLTGKQQEIVPAYEVGAINWKAPEVISGKTCGTFASDVYSFGMCIVEAVTGRVPWGMMPDVAVKIKILTQKELPKQPSEMNGKQWDLVRRMCAWEPKDRIRINTAVKLLAEFADEEVDQKYEAEWAAYKANEPTSEPDPVL